MKNESYRVFWRDLTVLISGVFTVLLMAGGSVALADGEVITVSGNSVFSDTCGIEGSDFGLLLDGDLEGCLSVFVEDFKCEEVNAHARYWESGREVFKGTLNGEQGKFKTHYTFDAAFAPGFCSTFDLSTEVGGGCIHKVRGKTGAFENAWGELMFIDVITDATGDPVTGSYAAGSGGNNFLYSGHIQLGDDE